MAGLKVRDWLNGAAIRDYGPRRVLWFVSLCLCALAWIGVAVNLASGDLP